MVTIITVCYNEKDTIEATMNSVWIQDYPDLEYIIKDGGSDDGTRELIRGFQERFERKGISMRFIEGKDHGLYDAMNRAVEEASGDWINFMNSGDRFFNETVLSDIFAGRSYDGTDLIYGDALEIEFGEYYFFRKCPELIEQRMPFNHQTVFASKQLLTEYPFDPRFPICADYHFLLRAYRSGKRFTDSGVITAVISKDGVSTVRLKETYLESIRVRRESGIPQPSEEEIRKELRFVSLKQFGMDHFPGWLKYGIRKLQRFLRKQPRVAVSGKENGGFSIC